MYTSEVQALISLIEDPDETIYSQVKNQLRSYGEMVIPQLEQFWEYQDFGPLIRQRVEELIAVIQYEGIYQRIKEWKNSENSSLLEGALIINRYQYPSFDEDELKRIVSRIRQDIWLELNDHLTAFESVKVFNYMFFQIHGFGGHQDFTDSPRHNFMTDVISTRKGNPVALGLLYTHLAQSLDLPIYAIHLPSQFILCYYDHGQVHRDLGVPIEDAEPLFYINPFTGGTVLHEEEVNEFITQQNLPMNAQFLQPCSNTEIISRMINNLIHVYIGLSKDDKVRELKTLQSLLLEKED
jgi:regulator of sirC expression with transglutaminase-like and TPR domain